MKMNSEFHCSMFGVWTFLRFVIAIVDVVGVVVVVMFFATFNAISIS